MAKYLIICILLISNFLYPQIQLTHTEKEALINICNTPDSLLKKESLPTIQSMYPSKFNNFIKQLTASKDVSINILDKEFLNRPGYEDLTYWYIYRELLYNKLEPDSLKKKQIDVLESVLEKKVDERWMVADYYYRISENLSLLFNTADLSSININIDDYKLKDETEKAIFFLSIVKSCGVRLKVMRLTGGGNPMSVINRFPKINGEKYYYFVNFDYPDFEYIGYKDPESFNKKELSVYYGVLINHLYFLLKNGEFAEIKDLIDNSILSKKELYHYTGNEDELSQMVDFVRKKVNKGE